ncbi:gliding motility protein RemB [Pontimicrobium sp. IMCC45349]|uniref:gliding motility protein RemB n=1 Tax=Pontimicrobium sp. IMCC45349 TaxID=3391574 RepID=UPI0039A26370
MKQFFLLLLVCVQFQLFAQDLPQFEKLPVFPECENEPIDNLKSCFYNQLSQFVYSNFKVPQIVSDESYKGQAVILFEVDAKGNFKVLYVDAVYKEVKEEVQRVFSKLPKIKPATYNGNPTYKQYTYQINVPLDAPNLYNNTIEDINTKNPNEELSLLEQAAKTELDSLNKNIIPYEDLEYNSQLNIPFVHQAYSRFDRSMNVVGANSHTGSKPFVYADVAEYYDLKSEKDKLLKEPKGWWQRKLFNERMVAVQGKGYWFTVDPIFDLQVGKDTDADFNSTFNNTRGLLFQGGVGEKLSFSTSVYESQGRFAQYFNQYTESLGQPGSENEIGVVPGRGISKRFKTDAFDYPVAEAYLSYAPSKAFNVQFGHGKNFIGDGYRSLLQSDVTSPYPFLKLNTKFWKIKYTNTWMWLKDIRPEVQVDGAYQTKYIANHYLSWNVSKKFNLGLFESVMWVKNDNRGFDINYLNPIIFYRAIEFETGQDAGNAILGASAKYKVNDNFYTYGQFILDEFSLNDIKGGEKSWKNKYGYQIGAKYFNVFKVDNLMLQLEYNRVRPYTYSHNTVSLNYAHNNQAMAHLWGANFSEAIAIARYHYGRWFADAKIVFGTRGLDFNTEEDGFSYGGDIYRDYDERPFDTGVEIGQGNKTNTFHAELQSGYLVNPATNLKLFAYLSYRNFNPNATTATTFSNNTVWFSLGLKTDLFNWYFDF